MADAVSTNRPRTRGWLWPVAVVGIVATLLIVAGFLRFWRLDQVPGFFHFDEGNNGVDALSVLAGHHAPFFRANRGREGLIIYAVAGFTLLLGRTILAARLTAAIASTGAVISTFWLGTILFADERDQTGGSRWRSFVLSSIAAGLMAVSLGQTIIGRTGLRANFLPLLLPLAVGLLWTGIQRHSLWRMGWAGFVTGLLAYTYISARVFPLLLVLWGVTFLFPLPNAHARVRAYARELIVFVVIALLIATPMGIYFVLNPQDFNARASEVWLFSSAMFDGNPFTTLLRNTWEQVSVLGFAGDPSWRSNYADRPLLNLAEAFLFWIGVAMLIWGWRKPSNRLLLLWLVVFLIPAVLSFDLPRNTFRMLAMAPAIYITIAAGLAAVADAIQRLVWRNANGPRPVLLWGVAAVGVCMVTLRGIDTTQTFFGRWAHEVEAHVAAPNVEWVDMIHVIAARPADAGEAFIVPISEIGEYARSSFKYLYMGVTPVHMMDTAEPTFAQDLQTKLRADNQARPLAAVKTLAWDREATADAPKRISFLLSKYGRYADSEQRTYYRIDRYTDLNLETPWKFYEQLEPMTVTLDGGVTLTGIAAGVHGGVQLPTQNTVPLSATADGPLWLVLQWRTDQRPKVDYRISLRLRDEQGAQVFQKDDNIVAANNVQTSRWKPGRSVTTYYLVDLPKDLTPGVYQLQAVVYDKESLTPTVQVGIWTPEIPLARIAVDP